MARSLLRCVLALALLLPAGAAAQPKVPVRSFVEGGIGYSSVAWSGDPARASYLPELTLVAAAPVDLGGSFVQPYAGLQFDAVGFPSPNEYKDHYTITSLRGGVLLLGGDELFTAGFGLEARRPVYVHGSLYSRGPDGRRAWVPTGDPPDVDRWGVYWVFRMGFPRGPLPMLFDLTVDSNGRSPLTTLFPRNPLRYVSFRYATRIKL